MLIERMRKRLAADTKFIEPCLRRGLERSRTKVMNHTAAAIREAADRGGYGYRWWKANDIENGVGYNALPMRALTEHLYDPAFWKALGKARSWQDTGAWLFHWHRFIDHIAFGKDVESFFSNL
jgi:hypothetical protein